MRRYTPIIAGAVLIATIACGDKFLHDNPYDPVVPVTIVVSGPDTLFSFNEVGQYSAQSTPVFPDTAFQFGSEDSVALAPTLSGAFASKAPPLYPATKTVRISALLGQIDTISNKEDLGCPTAPPCRDLGNCPPPPICKIAATSSLAWRHTASKSVVITQRLVRIQLRCPASHACDTLSAGGTWTVWADGFDALNQPILGLSGANANPGVSATDPVVATFVVRDTTTAALTPVGVRVANVTATKSGSTWIVATRGTLTDSLRLVVR